MSKDQYVFLPLKFYDDRFEAHDNISVGLAAPITIVEFVFVTVGKIFGIGLLNLLVGHTVADASVEFIERFPSKLGVGKFCSGLDRALKGGSPDLYI
jgi:hypothetical protein